MRNGTHVTLGKLNVKKTTAIAIVEDALALWCVWEQLEMAQGVLYWKWLFEGTKANDRQSVVPTSLREIVLEQLHDSRTLLFSEDTRQC